jgi:hypothetical protein
MASSVSPEHGFVAKTADGTYANKVIALINGGPKGPP